MANPTTNFGWVMPTATDLVTDLPADFNVFGQGVDTSMADLLGGTTGQVLAKNSNTNMDFIWTTPQVGDITAVTAGTGISGGGTSGDVTVTNSMATAYTTKGDLVPATGSAAFARLGVGANDTVLTADSTAATGMKWATPASGSMTSIASGSLSGNTLSLTSISGSYKDLVLILRDFFVSNATGLAMRINSDTGTSYSYTGTIANNATISAVGDNTTRCEVTYTDVKGTDNNNSLMIRINDYANTSSVKLFNTLANFYSNGNVRYTAAFSGGWYATPAAVTGVSVYLGNAAYSYSGGTYVLYGVN